jgi:hypothetical protein
MRVAAYTVGSMRRALMKFAVGVVAVVLCGATMLVAIAALREGGGDRKPSADRPAYSTSQERLRQAALLEAMLQAAENKK